MTNTWIVAVSPQISALIDTGRALGGTVTAVVAGTDPSRFLGVDRVIAIAAPEGVPAEALAPSVASAVAAQAGDVVLVANRPSERVLAGAVAAKLGAPILTGAKVIGKETAEISRYGGVTQQTISLAQPVVLVVDGGTAPSGNAAASETVQAEPYAATVTSTDASSVAQVNLSAAKRIVAVGRGFKSEADLQLAKDLAAAIGADLACSRPIAEGSGWLARDRYIGVSGQHVAPDVYIALGISGQLQHTVGMTDSRVVVAVNSDEHAPIFAGSDYGIVGDIYTVVPAITAAVK
ncbi:MAG: electron transfer flavoprotein subunit alpha/FixB family protein [Brooklawnia sp.]|nr:electron transfer flavoprotein subunit alpha/FixB family protein [Brooklawnia sp.]